MSRKEWIIFDTNVLINFYSAQPEVGMQIIEFFNTKFDDIWIPNQVAEEFLEKQESAQRYAMNQATTFNKRFEDKLNNLDSFLEKSYRSMKTFHFKEIGILKEELRVKSEEMKDKFKEFSTKNTAEQDNVKIYIGKVDSFIEKILTKKGEAFNYKELLEIFSEGEMRYKYNIPPGFQDKKKIPDAMKKKGNIAFEDLKSGYGDLILWKEILNFSVGKSVDIILISDDAKSDWSINSKIRDELVRELSSYDKNSTIKLHTYVGYLEEVFKGNEFYNNQYQENMALLYINSRKYFDEYTLEIETEIKLWLSEILKSGELIDFDSIGEDYSFVEILDARIISSRVISIINLDVIEYDVDSYIDMIIVFKNDLCENIGAIKLEKIIQMRLLRERKETLLDTIKFSSSPKVSIQFIDDLNETDYIKLNDGKHYICSLCNKSIAIHKVSNGDHVCELCLDNCEDRDMFYCSTCKTVKPISEEKDGECISCYLRLV